MNDSKLRMIYLLCMITGLIGSYILNGIQGFGVCLIVESLLTLAVIGHPK